MLICGSYLPSSIIFRVKKFKEDLRNMKYIARQVK
jgi:hypothetical protein